MYLVMVYDANSWENYSSYVAKRAAKGKRVDKKKPSNKERERRLREHNSKMKGRARYFADSMSIAPSVLECRMQELLKRHNIYFEFQKSLYIRRKDSSIQKFYIADFYIPSKSIIIETDGKFHDEQVPEDIKRTRTIQKQYSNMKIVRWRWHDFDSPEKIEKLISLLL